MRKKQITMEVFDSMRRRCVDVFNCRGTHIGMMEQLLGAAALNLEKHELRTSPHFLASSYLFWGAASHFKKAREEFIKREVMPRLTPEQRVAFARVEQGWFGLWELSQNNGPRTARCIDGQDMPPVPVEVVSTNRDGVPGSEHSHVVGWLVEFGESSALVMAEPCPAQAVKKLKIAASRRAWGRGDGFRRLGYDPDVLKLMFQPTCPLLTEVETFLGGELRHADGQIFAGQVLRNFLAYQHQYWSTFASRAEFSGFYDPRVPEADRAKKDLVKWSLAVAYAVRPDEVANLMAQIDTWRRDAMSRQVRRFPYLTKWLDMVLPLDGILFGLGSDANASVDHPLVHAAFYHRLARLNLDPDWLHEHDLDPAWTIEQALGWTSSHPDSDATEALKAAAHKHLVAMRWVALLDKWVSDETKLYHGPSYEEIRAGVITFCGDDFLRRPIRELPEPVSGAWTRILNILKTRKGYSDPPCIQDLPAKHTALLKIKGIAHGSVWNLTQGLIAGLMEWAEVPGGPGAVEKERSKTEVQGGLAELGELFGEF